MTTKQKPKTPARLAYEIAGWYGATAIMLAYILVSFNVVQADGVAYQLLNLTGALGIATIAFVKKVRQSLILNLFWALIALAALLAIFL